MKVLIATNNDMGLYKFRKELVEELVKTNEVYLSLPYGKYIDYFIELGCHYCCCEFNSRGKNPIKELQQMRYYRRLLNEINPDIVLTYTIKPNVYCGAACALANIPYVANITGLGTAVERRCLMQRITLTLYKYGLRKAQKVFFQNVENRDFMIEKGIVKTPYDMLPGSGVDFSQYKTLEYPRGETVDFMFISRIIKEKGIDQYIEAAKVIRNKYPETRFHVCGSSEEAYKEKLKRLNDDGTIIYHGLVDNIAGMHVISQCTVHPSYYPEGISNVLLESAACGRPIITTNRSGCKELIDDNVNGFVVKQKDSQDLIKKIQKFLGLKWEERKAMGLASRAKVEKEFNRKIVINKYLREIQLLEELKKIN